MINSYCYNRKKRCNMLVREIQPVRLGLNQFKINSKPANYKFALQPLKRDTVSFTGFYEEAPRRTRTNYRAYDRDTGYMVDLVMHPSIDFRKYGTDDKMFPGMIARNSYGSYGNFYNVYMKNSDFSNSSFVGTNFNHAKIHNSNLSGCDMSNANARYAKFAYSNFEDTLCRNTDFLFSNLQGANFNRANLQKANLAIANIIGADFSGAKNLPNVAAGAIYNKDTKFPAGYSPEQAYMLEFKSGANLAKAYLNALRLKSSDELGFDEYRDLNLENSILNKSRFEQLDMQNSVFDGSEMEKAVFDFCILNNTSFKNANLERACFKNSDLQDAKFCGPNTNLQYANFIGANLSGTDIAELAPGQLENALFSPSTTLPEDMTVEDAKRLGMVYVVEEVDFSEYNLYGINFKNFKFSQYGINDFTKANFERANLHQTSFDGAILEGCNFDKASLKYSSLKNANCKGASFVGTSMLEADIEGADFTCADLCGANLKGVKLNEKTIFTQAKYDENTLFPDGFSPAKHGMTLTPNTRGALR